ncbi:MAG TPA: polyphosphate kinase 1 [Bacteroidia bacterium]|jgi:polyphosphate kinase|nr:polyphosphate kinase 1 [Bacteroidia bacterium]
MKKKTLRKKLPLVNREISWLSFNDRVLQEAEDDGNPLLERLRFLGIYSNNRDEFFRVRVATLKRLAKLGKKATETIGGDPEFVMEQVQRRVVSSSIRFDRVYKRLLSELEHHRIHITDEKGLTREQGEWVQEYFREHIMPNLFPIMLDSAPSFPYLKDKSIYLAVKLERRERNKKTRYALIEVPTDSLSRFVVLPHRNSHQYVILLDDVIRYCLEEIFPLHEYSRVSAFTVKLTRDAELDLDNDISKSFLEKISGSVKKRKKGAPVRFLYDKAMPTDLFSFLRKKLKVIKQDNIIPGSRYHNFKDFISFPDLGHKELVWPDVRPLSHPRFSPGINMFSAIRAKDVLLHFPYHSFHHIIDLLREASIDPRVKKIQITLYRVAKNSNVVNALINAVKNGKEVVVVMELQARFDEENNIFWANRLQEEGARVIFGVPGIKVHSKLFLISRHEEGKFVHYAHVGSGNMNETTAKIYTDKSLLTADRRITEEVQQVFSFFSDNLKHGNYKHLGVAPFGMRRKFVTFIEKEIDHATKGRPAWMILKINNLVDRDMILKLYEASRAGVRIKLIIRGTCALVPGVKGFSENIEVISILGRFLEHSRVFIFSNGGDEKYFISSADWMTRNLDHRSEVAVPIYDRESQLELRHIISLQLRDNKKARVIGGREENAYRTTLSKKPLIAQEEIRSFLERKAKAFGRKNIRKKKVEVRSNRHRIKRGTAPARKRV